MKLYSTLSAIFLASSLGFASIAIAQTETTNPSSIESSVTEETLKKPFKISPSGTIELPNGTTASFKSTITEPPEGLRNSTDGINLNGAIGYVPYDGKKLVVTVVEEVSKGENTVTIPRRIEAQEFRDKTTLSQSDNINLEVDPADLDEAIDQLNNMVDEKPEESGDEENEAKNLTDNGQSNSDGGSVGGGSTGNSLASGYQTPQQDDFTDPQTEVKTTIDGCQIRIDNSQNMAIQQNKTQTFEDGKLKTESQCTDSEVRYPLLTSFDGCTDIIDMNALTAYRQSKTYYNKSGSQVTVSSCAKDTSATYKIDEDTGACSPIIDRGARLVTIYAKLTYTGSTNAPINVRGCAPSNDHKPYPLDKSYQSCTHKIDLPNKYAYDRYTDYYVNNLGTRIEVSDCTVDIDKKWLIVEFEGSCKAYLDFTEGEEKVYKQSVMKYTDDTGTPNEARGCDKSTLTEPVSMTKDTSLCSIRHDFDENQSHEMYLWKYTLDDVLFQASACADTDVVFAHEDVKLDASGAKICTANVDVAAKLVTLFYRTAINVNDNVQYITECKPDSSNKLSVIATIDGCTDPAAWQHNLAAQISYENERYYYNLNGRREYVTPCQQGSKTYMHDTTTIGWQLHDDKLYALPISKVVINDTPIGQYIVSVNTVLAGAVQQPYIYEETKDIASSTSGVPSSFQGCTGLSSTDKTEIYKRPDDTFFNKVIGAGASVTEDVCIDRDVGFKVFHVGHRFYTENCTYEENHYGADGVRTRNGKKARVNPLYLYSKKISKINRYNNDIVSNYYLEFSSHAGATVGLRQQVKPSGMVGSVYGLAGSCNSSNMSSINFFLDYTRLGFQHVENYPSIFTVGNYYFMTFDEATW